MAESKANEHQTANRTDCPAEGNGPGKNAGQHSHQFLNDPLPPVALKLLAAIRQRAGPDGIAIQPPGGWPKYAGISRGSFHRWADCLPGIKRTRVKPKSTFRVTPLPVIPELKDYGAYRWVSAAWLILPPTTFYVAVQLAIFAKAQTGEGRPVNATIAQRCGLCVRQVQTHLCRLKKAGFFRRRGDRWYLKPRQGKRCKVPVNDLARFGFKFPGNIIDPGHDRYDELMPHIAASRNRETYMNAVLPHCPPPIGHMHERAARKALAAELDEDTIRDIKTGKLVIRRGNPYP